MSVSVCAGATCWSARLSPLACSLQQSAKVRCGKASTGEGSKCKPARAPLRALYRTGRSCVSGLRHSMCAVFHDQQHVLACAPRTNEVRSDDRCGICGFVCGQLHLGKKKPQDVHLRCLCTCTDGGLSKLCGRSFAVADNCVRSWFKGHSCPLNRRRSYHDLPFN